MNAFGISGVVKIQPEAVACVKCGSTSRVGHGLCLNCLLQEGLGPETENSETLEKVLEEIDVHDADWRLGNYQILEEIGRGGMGVIYRARQRHSRRIVALKRVLSFHADSRETLARFRREAEAAASLDHPNVLPIYEVSESEDGLPFFSMKFAAGGSLVDMARTLRDDARQIVRLISKVTRAVEHAHGHGILHRDLKPGNVLLDGRGEPLVSDFGLAKWLDTTSDLTRTLTIFGTPGYIAPEQAQGPAKNLTGAADIYSIGAILFDLFTGRPPFLGEHALSVIKQAAEKPAPKLRTLAPSADRDLETICARCLEREPHARYRSAGGLAEDLERWLEGRPIIARPVSPPTRIWRWSKRNPKLASAAAMAAALGIFATIAFLSSQQLREIVQGEAAAARSISLLNFEDLDELAVDSPSARQFDSALRTELAQRQDLGLSQAFPKTQEDFCKPQEWKDLGKALGVRNILSGTIRKNNSETRISAHLVDAISGAKLKTWIEEGDSYQELATSLTNAVNATVRARVNRQDPPSTPNELRDTDFVGATNNPKAKDFYVAAQELRARLNVSDFYRSITLLEKAVETDPNYGAAYATLASAYQSRADLDPSGPWLQKANAAAEIAIRLLPASPGAQFAYAGMLRHRGQFKEALTAYITGWELDQTNDRAAAITGNTLSALGRPDLALRWYEKAVRRQPRPGIYSEYIGDAWSDMGEDVRAKAEFLNALTFRPDLSGAAVGLAKLALLNRKFDDARKQCHEAQMQDRFKDDWDLQLLAAQVEFCDHRFNEAERLYRDLLKRKHDGELSFSSAIRFLSALGFIRRQAGDESGGRKLLQEALNLDLKDLQVAADNPMLLCSLAADYAALGAKDEVIEYLQRAVSAGWIDHRFLSLDPRFDFVRDAPQFKNIFLHLGNKVKAMDAAAIGRTAIASNSTNTQTNNK